MQDESQWGLTRIQYAQIDKQRRREREKKRRQRAMKRVTAVVSEMRPALPFFETSGIRAVTVRLVASAYASGAQKDSVPLSLPYVEFIHGRRAG